MKKWICLSWVANVTFMLKAMKQKNSKLFSMNYKVSFYFINASLFYITVQLSLSIAFLDSANLKNMKKKRKRNQAPWPKVINYALDAEKPLSHANARSIPFNRVEMLKYIIVVSFFIFHVSINKVLPNRNNNEQRGKT